MLNGIMSFVFRIEFFGPQDNLTGFRGGGQQQGGPSDPGQGGPFGRPGEPFDGPESGSPNFFNITCTEQQEDMSCELPRGDEEGVFVRRTRTHPTTGETNTVPKCIPIDKATEGDECGCCGEACPEPCETCSCELPFPDHEGEIMEGVEVLVEGMQEALCVPKFACMMIVARSEGRVTRNTECA
jgi:hypothetical protein